MPLSSHFKPFSTALGVWIFVCLFVFKDLALNNKRRSNYFGGSKFNTLLLALIDKH